MYNVTFQSLKNKWKLSSILFSAAIKFQKPGPEQRLLEALQVDTEYVIIVTAINGFWSSLPSDSVLAATKVFTS